ncbi:M50 family metallopeptidase [Bacillus gobiensis]|uniref:M50 family metallopeptidase n=1 Tax=Bacillus gobiensis TaxID=1441095 RepID=UPI003D2413EE
MNKGADLLAKLHIHPCLWVVMGICLVTGYIQQFLCLFLIVLIHELGHSIAALFFSWRVKRILLLPFGGLLEAEEHGNRPLKEELVVIAAGPIQHVLLQLAAWLFFLLSGINQSQYDMFTFYNFSILLINLLPIWPLDGGKLAFILLSKYFPYQTAHRYSLLSSSLFCLLLLLWFAAVSPMQLSAWILLVFLTYSLYDEYRKRHFTHIRFLLERYYGKKRELGRLTPIKVSADDKILDVLSKFRRDCKHPIHIEKDGRTISELDENELLHAYFAEKRTNTSMEELMYLY